MRCAVKFRQTDSIHSHCTPEADPAHPEPSRSAPRAKWYPLASLLALLCGGEVRADEAPYQVTPAREPRRVVLRGERPRFVLLISVDGLSHRMLRVHRAVLPHLKGLIRRGFVRPLYSAFPSVTWTAHASMLTGQHPAVHGVLGNRWLDGRGRVVKPYAMKQRSIAAGVPTVLELAGRAGLRAATLNWPNTQGLAEIADNWPEHMYVKLNAATMSPRLLGIARRLLWRPGLPSDRARRADADQTLERIALKERTETDALVVDLARSLLSRRRTRPRLLLAHFVTLDSWLHRYGNTPWIERNALLVIDQQLGRLLAAYRRYGMLKQTAVLVASDHGFSSITHRISIEGLLAGLSPALRGSGLDVLLNGHSAFVYLTNAASKALLPQVLKTLADAKDSGCLRAILEPKQYAKLGLPLPDAKTPGVDGGPDLVAIAADHCVFAPQAGASGVTRIRHMVLGHHGGYPDRPDLVATLVGAGPGLRQHSARLPAAHITDVAATVAALLDLRWPKRWPRRKEPFTLAGRALKDILR